MFYQTSLQFLKSNLLKPQFPNKALRNKPSFYLKIRLLMSFTINYINSHNIYYVRRRLSCIYKLTYQIRLYFMTSATKK
jgi:hypothetical protein